MKILHLEDNCHDVELVHEILRAEFPSCVITAVTSKNDFEAALTTDAAPDLILSDFTLPSFDGLTALALARERAPDVPFIFLSGSIGEERAIAAVRGGAYDYVLKDNMARLPVAIRRAMDDFARRRLRKEDERRLLELAGVIERSTEAIVVSDISGRITLWNAGATRLYGIGAPDVVGRKMEDILAQTELLPLLHTARDAVLETGEWQREVNITTRDHRNIIIDLRMTLVRDDAGRPSARLSIATDITEKKKLEEQFLRSQRLESLGLLAAGIAHDLNNVLAPVLMAAPLLRQRATANEDLRVLDILEKSAQRGSALVRQILGFAHGAGGGSRFTQVKHLLRDVTEVIQASFPKSIVLDQGFAADLWPIQANPTQIHQILLNLAVNARDAMPRGGTLRVQAENRLLSERDARAIDGAKPGAFLVLEIGDTGTGISPEVLARIWEPFFTTKGEGKGTGLGLSTVRGIAARHGGFVTVETRLGHGTVFRVFLPAGQPAADDKDTAQRVPTMPRGQGELILVVDDEADMRNVASAILTKYGYHVITCRDGVEAIALFTERAAEIRLVISDLNMPNLDGAALALVLRRLQPDVKILVMTGLDSRDSLRTPDSAEFAATISKPFTVEALLGIVHQMLKPGLQS